MVADMQRDLKRAAEQIPHFRQQLLDTELLETLAYHDDLAAAVVRSSLNPAQRPYALQYFGRINGKWKSLEWQFRDAAFFSSVAAAEACFREHKDPYWQDFVAVREDVRHGHRRSPPSLSTAEKAELQRRQRETWQMSIGLDMPRLEPPVVQYAVLDEDPVPSFMTQVQRMRDFHRQQLAKADDEARKVQLRAIQMAVDWDQGFRTVTGDQLYLLTQRPGAPYSTVLSSNASAGRKWIVTKTVQIEGKPVCWCVPVQVKRGESIDVMLNRLNVFDLQAAFAKALADAGNIGGQANAPTP